MNQNQPTNGTNGHERDWTLTNLLPSPEEEWLRLKSFLNLNQTDFDAMLATVEPLFRRGPELVVGTYDYLLQNHDTAVILGWENGADEKHLAERRRFFTVWLARLLGLDLSDDFARYLFQAGQKHAAHGPRQTHVPETYVTGSISLVNATFARFLSEEMGGDPVVPAALAGWNKLLTMHQHLMNYGYRIARAWDAGDFTIKIDLFGRMRRLAHPPRLQMGLPHGGQMSQVLEKFFNYYPQARPDVFAIRWQPGERLDERGTPWMTVQKMYQVQSGWRVLLNGRDLVYTGGLHQPVAPGDTISIFPPGR